MTTNRKSENHNPNGPHDLGQITKDDEMKCERCGKTHTVGMVVNGKQLCPECWNVEPLDYPQWVIVENGGTDEETEVIDFYRFETAERFIRTEGHTTSHWEIMRRKEDGTLTTEY